MGKKQKGGILPFLMLMNAMKGGGIKKRKRKKHRAGLKKKQKGGGCKFQNWLDKKEKQM